MYWKYFVCLAFAWCPVLLPLHLSAQEAAAQPLVSYDQLHPLMRENPTPMVQVFASGKVEVNRPPGRKRPGLYQFTLAEQQIVQIKRLMAGSSGAAAAVFAVTQARAVSRSRERTGERTLTIETDPTTTVIAINQAALPPKSRGTWAAPGAASGGALQRISVENLSEIAGLSDRPSLQSARELELLLLNLYNSAGK